MASLRVTCFALLATGLLAGMSHAQSDTNKPLDLTVAPSKGFPAASVASATPAATTPASTTPATGATPVSGATPANVNTAPGVYYGDTSGATGVVAANNPDATTDSCDAADANKAQVHGSVSTGVVAGNHVSGSYEAATVNITKPFGDCKHPSGGLSITVGGSQSHFAYPRGH